MKKPTCPNCGKEMVHGNVTLPNNTTWYPGEMKKGIVKGQIWLAGRWKLLGKQAKGYLCKECKWVTINYPG